MSLPRHCSVVIPAAGSGSRLGSDLPKQYVEIAGKPVIVHTIERLNASGIVDEIVVAASVGQHVTMLDIVEQAGWTNVTVIVGGETRQESVTNALRSLMESPPEIVAIHDAVRPFFSHALLSSLVETAYQFDAAVPLLPVTESIHRVEGDFVESTPNRNEYALAQTPQCFRFELLLRALEQARADNFDGTDEAGVVHRCGHRVRIVEGERENFKITHYEDLTRAEARLTERS